MKLVISPLFLILLSLFGSPGNLQAQTYVTIPDPLFVIYLQQHYPTCMSGSKLNIDCDTIATATQMDVTFKAIKSLYGVQYFTGLTNLNCGGNELTFLPALPDSLKVLNCSDNYLASLPTLPSRLISLDCSGNDIPVIPAFPGTLTTIYCDGNVLSVLPVLPPSLYFIDCSSNKLSVLPGLPATLNYLACNNNKLLSLPVLPARLRNLYYANNQVHVAPQLPDSLVRFACAGNQMATLPALPLTLETLICEQNQFTVLPVLPPHLKNLYCQQNRLTVLPTLPDGLELLYCQQNKLVSLPRLPHSLVSLSCYTNQINCFPEFPQDLTQLMFFDNLNTCVPNYVPAMGTNLPPLCVAGDAVHNPHNCQPSKGILGSVSQNTGSGCGIDPNHTSLPNIAMKLYDNSGTLVETAYTSAAGLYDFPAPAGSYTIKLDVAGKPYVVQCAYPGIDSTVVLTTAVPLVQHVDFSVACKPGFDIGCQSVVKEGEAFPGKSHAIHIVAGDMTQWYGMSCLPSGSGGVVKVVVVGPVTYADKSAGALTANTIISDSIVVGTKVIQRTTFVYIINDFSMVNNTTAFGFLLNTILNSGMGESICISVEITTAATQDYNTANNTYHYCYEVVNSHDPNEKEVFPVNVEPGFADYFTYTVHFQNTGNAPAHEIQLVDTLDENLDMETFEVINYSHPNSASLKGNVLHFDFPNIMLEDSTSNEAASHGFVQYRVKPKTHLPAGTQVKNTAYIFFDFNPAIVTNTTVNEFVEKVTAGMNDRPATDFTVYPNPGKGVYTVRFSGAGFSQSRIIVYNLLGEQLELISPLQETVGLDLTNQPDGVYILSVSGPEGNANQRLIKQ